jgi:hypothetical protein
MPRLLLTPAVAQPTCVALSARRKAPGLRTAQPSGGRASSLPCCITAAGNGGCGQYPMQRHRRAE